MSISRSSGYFICYRNVWKHPVFKNLMQSAIWLYMISSASHKDKNLSFINNKIFVKRGELIFPLRKNAKNFNITYSEMRSLVLRLKRRNMILTRLAHLQPNSDHLRQTVTIISVVNYDKFQYVDSEQSLANHLQRNTNNNTNNITNISMDLKNNVNKSSKDIVYTGNHFGEFQEVVIQGKRYHKHRWKDEVPLKEIK